MGTRFTETGGGVEEELTGLVALVAGGEGGAVEALCEGAQLAQTGGGVEEVLAGGVTVKARRQG